ncbi:response regulator transcription factor [Paenibacillus fonticola]|uniref:response regulator transcription factor n=1 Tax=Paenibacillus fonticola TaxID=379896 RepID=UPI0003682706|nr:helix-turn-helix domain-containing protein [Paenibacillus fonticola]
MRALIVDDEARVRRAVRLLVDWKAHGIEEVEEAENGTVAIDLIRQVKPVIVIMDMMMPSGSGLELMAWVSEYAGNIKFIVVSGHDDFDFVRNTVRHGGIDYILKPIDKDAINVAVSKAVAAWQREETDRMEYHRKNVQLNELKPIYGEKLLTSLIDDPFNAAANLRRLQADGVISPDFAEARLLLLQTDGGDIPLLNRFGNDSELLHFAMINICNEFLRTKPIGVAFKYWGVPGEIILLVWENPDQVSELIADMNEGLFHTLQRRMHFGIGTTGTLPESLPEQYAEAQAALRRRNLLIPEAYVHALKAAPSPAEIPVSGPGNSLGQKGSALQRQSSQVLSFRHVQEDWKMAVMSGRREAITMASQKWIDDLGRGGFITPELLETWKRDALAFCTQLLRETLSDEADKAITRLAAEDQDYPAPHTSGYSFSLYAWRDWSLHLMDRLTDIIAECRAKESRTIGDIVGYIEQHYAEEVTLQDIASRFYVSREYVSRKFKQDFGINFSDFLAHYRIDKSKQLMHNPHLTITQIAELVGFNDVKYFSKVFKKQEGLSPKMYRSKLEA